MRFLGSILAGVCALIAATSCPAANHQVLVGGGTLSNPDAGFHPREITINVGDTITFRNQAVGLAHNIHARDESFRCAEGCVGSGGTGEPSAAHWEDTLAFDHAGTIAYQCDPHVAFGMTGTIHVVEAGGAPTAVPITSGFTGAWFDPAQSGHGILIEVLPNNQLLAYWFTFDPDGTQQSWFGSLGPIDPATNTATLDALQSQGGRWIPNFDPGHVTQADWGSLVFSFTDCNHGRVDFDSGIAGYGQGHMDLTRLTLPAGLSCP
jgi:plastocyanin